MAEVAVRETPVRKGMVAWDLNDTWRLVSTPFAFEMMKAYDWLFKHGKNMFDHFGEGDGSKVRWREFTIDCYSHGDTKPKEH